MEQNQPGRQTDEKAHILTIKVVEFASKPVQTQQQVIRALVSMLHEAIPAEHNLPVKRSWRPALGGGTLVFWQNVTAALDTAISLDRLVRERDDPSFEIQMGLHTGEVTEAIDFDEQEQLWGEGINLSAHLAELAHPGQILVSGRLYKQADLHETPDEVTFMGKWWIAEDKSIEVYNVYLEGIAGIPPEEGDDETWYKPFHYPLERAIRTYEAMIKEYATTGPAFRSAVFAKRLLDLDPRHESAQQVIRSISRRHLADEDDALPLYDEFFSELSPSALLHFFRNAKFKAFKKGEVIVEERERADSLMMVVSGQIVPLRYGVRLKEPDPENPQKVREVLFREGHITGEMGLFNPAGTRTATLAAYTDTITLVLDYDLIKVEDGLPAQERANRLAIQDRIWGYYCDRALKTEIFGHPLFKPLSNIQRNRLQNGARFLPETHGRPVMLSVDAIWNAWTVVISGRVTVQSKENKTVEYGPGDCLGTVRLLVTGEPPFSKVEVAANTHLVRFHWLTIRSLLRDSEKFRQAALAASSDDMIRFGLL